jgi:hypothetical protein
MRPIRMFAPVLALAIVVLLAAGATAALDILAREAGKHVVDWDTPDD